MKLMQTFLTANYKTQVVFSVTITA